MPQAHPWVVLDEVQRAPALLNEVHRLIEHYQRCFVLTGSSSRQLRRGGANLLAGRAYMYHMYPLTATEIGPSFDWLHAFEYGLLPGAYLDPQPALFLESYVATYLREEVQQEGLVRQIGTFSRFMEIASFSQGSQLNLSAIAREVGVSRRIVAQYFEILEDLLIAVQLPCFTPRAKRVRIQHPKFYYFDVEVFRHLRPKGPLDTPQDIGGAAFETLFLQHLRATIDYAKSEQKIYFWRSPSGQEVDFVVYGEKGLWAFELKSRTHIDRKDFSALKAFQKEYPMAQCHLVYAGDHVEQHGNFRVWPIRDLLFKLPELLDA